MDFIIGNKGIQKGYSLLFVLLSCFVLSAKPKIPNPNSSKNAINSAKIKKQSPKGNLANLKPFQNAGPVLKGILKRKEIRIGIQHNYQPFHIAKAKPGYPGIDIELARALAKYLGVGLKTRHGSISELISWVNKGKLDLSLGGISSELERSPYVCFSEPYVETSPGALLSKRALPLESDSVEYNPKRFRNLGDLGQAGILSLGVRKDTANYELLSRDRTFQKHKILLYNSREELLAALKDGNIDALIADSIEIRALMQREKSFPNRFLPIVQTYQPEHISAALPRGDATFLYEINFFIKEMKRTRRLERIISRYLSDDKWIPGT